LSSASLVVGEESDAALDERPDQVPIGEAVGLLAPEDPDDGGVAAAAVGQIQRAGEYCAFAGEVDDDLLVRAFVERLVKGDGRRRLRRIVAPPDRGDKASRPAFMRFTVRAVAGTSYCWTRADLGAEATFQ
jgi:hypothetical protein